MENNKGKSFGKRIKENLGKRWQGAKNIFGNAKAIKTKEELKKLAQVAEQEYKDLDVKEEKITEGVLRVWKALYSSLICIREMCDSVEADKNGKGRAYGRAVMDHYGSKIKEPPTSMSYVDLNDFNEFENHVIALKLIADKTSMTSALPYNIKKASDSVVKFYAWAYAYDRGKFILQKIDAAQEYLMKYDSLWENIKEFFGKNKEKTLKQIRIDASKVAAKMYARIFYIKGWQLLKTADIVKLFKFSWESFKNMFKFGKKVKGGESDFNYIGMRETLNSIEDTASVTNSERGMDAVNAINFE